MAEFVVSTLLNFVLDKVSSCIGVNEELKKLQSTLLTIQAVLEDAEARQPKEKSIKIWLRKLKDVTYDADDLLDRIVDEDRKIESSKRKKARHYLNSLTFRNDLARSIKEIRERLDEIAEERSMFHLQERVVVKGTKEDTGVLREETGSFVNESEVLGREKDKEKIVEFLINKSSGGDLGVLAIVGMGGLGKTTVAQVAYNDENVCKDFDERMWICVSDDFDSKRICRSIIESVTRSKCKLRDMDSIQRSLIEELRGKRFLLVLDDVWDEDEEKWGSLRSLLRSGVKGSKIIVTTRIANVAHIMGTVPPYELPILSEDDCWNLFEERAFGLGGANKTQNLVAIGKEIVKKCGGVPLAARALGSLMRFKKWESEWLTIKDSELWKLTDDKTDILPALTLSYNHLPSRLKQCFAYCSIFPKDYEIEKKTLVQLWIAEGFIRSSNENTHLDDTGFQYVDELLSRSLLQIGLHGVKNLKMHDLVHDLARSVAGEECSIADASTGKGFFKSSRYSSFLISKDISAIQEPLNQAKKLRTFHLINPNPFARTEQLQKLLYVVFSKLKLLRALHLRFCPIKSLPGSVRNLDHLRYLCLSGADFKTLPSCVGDLHNLLTFNLTLCKSLQALPKSISNLHNLLTLDLGSCEGLLSLPSSIGRLTSLQKLNLKSVKSLQALPESIGDLHNLLTLNLGFCEGLLSLPSSIGRLTSLQKLNLHECESLEALPESIGELHNLLTLDLGYCKGLLSLPSSIGRLSSLQKLNLKNCKSLQALPESIGELHNLLTLDLQYCDVLLSLPNSIGCLTSLLKLILIGCVSLQALPESVSSLQKLQELYLEWCTELVQLPENTSNMRSLLHLSLTFCICKCLPPFGQLPKLKRLILRELPAVKCLGSDFYGCDGAFPSLEELTLDSMPALEEWSGATATSGEIFPSLSELFIRHCPKLKALPSTFPLLRKLHLESTPAVEEWSRASATCGEIFLLSELSVRDCPKLKALPSTFPLLKKLYLYSMPDLEEWSGATAIGGEIFPSISSLSIIDCPKLKALPPTFPFVTHLDNR